MYTVKPRGDSSVDWQLLFALTLIPLCGLIVLYSAGYDSARVAFSLPWPEITVRSQAFVKQCLFVSAGLCSLGVVALIPVQWLYRLAYPLFVLCIVSLVAVLIFGTISNGSRRWFALGALKFQPSELMKLATALAMARFLSRYPHDGAGYSFKQLLLPMALVLLPVALIMKQPDLGTSLAVLSIGGGMILFVGVRKWTLAWMTILAGGLLVPAWHFLLKPYQRRRILTLFNPDNDPLGSGYHIIQSKIAVGSGAVFGKGFMQGTQTQLEFLPEHTTDFVFSVLAEEWGFVGCAVVLSLYLFCLYRIASLVAKRKDLFSALVMVGVGTMLFFHVMVNVGMVVGIMPVVGLPLPLFSYGGSSVLSFMIAFGIVVGLSARKEGPRHQPSWRM